MSFDDRRKRGPGDLALVVLLIVAGFALSRLQSGAAKNGQLDPVSLVVRRAVGLLSDPLNGTLDATAELGSRLREGDKLARENEDLKAQLAALSMYTERIGLLEGQVSNLRTLGGLGKLPGHDRVLADVVGFNQYEGRITLSAGTEKGIGRNMPVICADGLVAVVQTAWRGGSQAALITNASIQVGGLDLTRKPPIEGLLKGRDPSTLVLTFFDPKAPAKPGDFVVTSGHSGRIPRLLKVGKIISVEDDPDYGIRRANVAPNVNMGTLKEVQVIK